jgi:hypothetical protein
MFLKYVLLLVIAFIGGDLIDRTYHLIKHGSFISTPFTGVQLATEAIYVAKENDYTLFYDEPTRKIVQSIQDSVYAKKLNLRSYVENHSLEPTIDQIQHYSLSYNEIAHRIIINQLLDHYTGLEGIKKWKAIDDITIKISLTIIKANFRDYILICIKDIQKNGFRDNILMISFIVLIILAVYNIKKSNIAAYILFSGIMLIANYLLVAIIEPILFRYAMYTNLVFLIVIVSTIISYFHNNLPAVQSSGN